MESVILFLVITQIIIESLPISSSGHVTLVGLLAYKLFGIQNVILPDFLDNLLHGTALIAILIIFFKDWFFLVKKLLQACFQFILKSKPLSFSQKRLFAIFVKISGLVIVADLVTAVLFFIIKIWLPKTAFYSNFFGNSQPIILLVGFIITMLLLFSLKLRGASTFAHKSLTSETLNFKKTAILGLVQGCALLPGISRFASTYVAGCWLNLSPRRSFQISFLIQLPLIVAAFLFLGVRNIFQKTELVKSFANNIDISRFLIILAAATIAVLALRTCYSLAIKNRLWWFGIYMLIPIITLIYILF